MVHSRHTHTHAHAQARAHTRAFKAPAHCRRLPLTISSFLPSCLPSGSSFCPSVHPSLSSKILPLSPTACASSSLHPSVSAALHPFPSRPFSEGPGFSIPAVSIARPSGGAFGKVPEEEEEEGPFFGRGGGLPPQPQQLPKTLPEQGPDYKR